MGKRCRKIFNWICFTDDCRPKISVKYVPIEDYFRLTNIAQNVSWRFFRIKKCKLFALRREIRPKITLFQSIFMRSFYFCHNIMQKKCDIFLNCHVISCNGTPGAYGIRFLFEKYLSTFLSCSTFGTRTRWEDPWDTATPMNLLLASVVTTHGWLKFGYLSGAVILFFSVWDASFLTFSVSWLVVKRC